MTIKDALKNMNPDKQLTIIEKKTGYKYCNNEKAIYVKEQEELKYSEKTIISQVNDKGHSTIIID